MVGYKKLEIMEKITLKSNGLEFYTNEIYDTSSDIISKILTAEKKENLIIPKFEYYAALTAGLKKGELKESRTRFKTESSRSMRSRLTYMYIVGSLLNRNDNFCDLGSHVGMIGHFCAQYTSGNVVMYECNLDKWQESRRLGRNNEGKAIANRFQNCHYEYSAVSTSSGITKFFVNKEKTVGSSINRHLAGKVVEEREVPMTSVTEILTLHKPNVIKINVEGEDVKIVDCIINEIKTKRIKYPRTIIFEITWTKDVEMIIERCIETFRSTILIEMNQPVGQKQMKAQVGESYLQDPVIKPHHMIVSFEEEKDIVRRLNSGITQMNDRWDFEKQAN